MHVCLASLMLRQPLLLKGIDPWRQNPTTLYWPRHLLVNTTLFGSDAPTIWIQITQSWSKQYFHHASITLSSFHNSFTLQAILFFHSINSFLFFDDTKLLQSDFLYFHKRTVIICSSVVSLKAQSIRTRISISQHLHTPRIWW